MREYFIPTRVAIIIFKNNKITSVGKDVEKLEPLYVAGGNVKSCSAFEKQFGGS